MTCIVSRNWLLGGYEANFSFQTALKDFQLTEVAHRLLQTLKVILSSSPLTTEIRNQKGRTPSDSLLSGLPESTNDELLSIGGSIATSSSSSGFDWSPFRLSIVSNFSRFEGTSSIVFSCQSIRTTPLPEWLPWWLLGSAAPIRIDYLRFGLELFTSKFSIARLGFVPIVSESLLIDATSDTFALRLTTQQPRWKPCNPFQSSPEYHRISESIDQILGVSLSTLFEMELARAAVFRC